MLTIPNDVGIYDNANYLHHPIITITGKRFFRVKPTFSAQLLMIKWWPIGRSQPGASNGLIRLSAIAGVGNLPPVDFQHSIDRTKSARFISTGFNGLDYSIELQQIFSSTQIQISEYLPAISFENNPQHINMSVNIGPGTDLASNSSTANTITGSVSSMVLALPSSRKGGLIENKTNRVLWTGFGIPATVGAPCIGVPAGGNEDIPAGFIGQINGVCAGNAAGLSGVVQVTEYIQI